MGREFDSSMCHNKSPIGEEGNGKPHHKCQFPRKNSKPCLWFLQRFNSSSMQHSFFIELVLFEVATFEGQYF